MMATRPKDHPIPADVAEAAVRRILVALDATEDSLDSLDIAAGLAAKLRAEIEGLFIEDINLLRMAGLPCTRVVSVAAPGGVTLTAASMERELQRQARYAREALAQSAERMRVRWTFRTVRGVVAQEVIAAAAGVDLVVVGKVDRTYPQRLRFSPTARIVSTTAPSAVLLAHRHLYGHGSHPGTIVVAFDDSATGHRALHLAAAIAAAESHPLSVLIDSGRAAERHEAAAVAVLAGYPVKARFRHVARRDAGRLVDVIHGEAAELFVIGSESPLMRGRAGTLVERLDVPVLLTRLADPAGQPVPEERRAPATGRRRQDARRSRG
jgi:nucleotide-binding universal stress UspA family protein